jgi:hypothetical protein
MMFEAVVNDQRGEAREDSVRRVGVRRHPGVLSSLSRSKELEVKVKEEMTGEYSLTADVDVETGVIGSTKQVLASAAPTWRRKHSNLPDLGVDGQGG